MVHAAARVLLEYHRLQRVSWRCATRGFVNDGRIENRSTFTALTRQSTGTLEVRFRGGGQVGQNWHEHLVG